MPSPTWFEVLMNLAGAAFCFALGFTLGVKWGIKRLLKRAAAIAMIAEDPPP